MSIMLTGDMELWHGLVIAAASLFLHSCLLIAITYLLRRHIAHQTERILKETRLQACRPSPTHCYSPATKDMKATWTGRGTPVSAPRYRNDSDTSSDSSPPTCQVTTLLATKDVNYTQVVFSAPEELNKESFLDYEDVKETMDYVNVNPKSHKPNNWTCPTVSEPVEYTQVAM
ncbi:regulator of hemoglobinization and erythroid cell expansion protein isoform X1 [Castor canadensis]|uniref:Regulator of hemoglobinization and erythroid cell expansion protein isoform X1 n=5 Tax=Castor canadensis TaxID=51338 RepID=A0AC58KI28_CASCN